MLEEWITGRWYLSVTCRNCGTEFPFSRDGEMTTHNTSLIAEEWRCSDYYIERETTTNRYAGKLGTSRDITIHRQVSGPKFSAPKGTL